MVDDRVTKNFEKKFNNLNLTIISEKNKRTNGCGTYEVVGNPSGGNLRSAPGIPSSGPPLPPRNNSGYLTPAPDRSVNNFEELNARSLAQLLQIPTTHAPKRPIVIDEEIPLYKNGETTTLVNESKTVNNMYEKKSAIKSFYEKNKCIVKGSVISIAALLFLLLILLPIVAFIRT